MAAVPTRNGEAGAVLRAALSGVVRRGPALPSAFLLSALLLGCGDERGLQVRLDVPEGAAPAQVCLTAHGTGELVFARSWPADEARGGTLTFVAGDRVDRRLRLSARLRRGGRRVADATAEESFAPAAERVVDLELARCHPRGAPPPEIVVGAVSGAERLAAGDLDGDGVDEVVASGPDGATVLGGEVLSSEPLRVSGLADLDGDCLPEVFGVSASGVVALPTGTLSARGEHVVVGDAGQGLGVGAGDADGLRWGLVDGVMRGLTGSPVRGLAIGDLNGDGVDDLLAVGEAGVSAFFGGPAGPTAAVGTAPTAWTGQSVALGDFDDDGALDAAVGGDGLVRVGRNRGDGLLEGRPTLDAPGVRALRAIDADGDCADDLVVLGEGEATLWLGAEDAALREGGALPGVLDAVAADLDGDGSRELVLLGADGEVRTWVP